MMYKSTFQDWDFINIWSINEGSSYPYLKDMDIPNVTPPGNENIPVAGIALNKTSYLMTIGETLQLIAKIIPENATDKINY